MSLSAKELRAQAMDLLKQAEVIDGFKPHALMCRNSYARPSVMIGWSDNGFGEVQVMDMMDADTEEDTVWCIDLSLDELFWNVKE